MSLDQLRRKDQREREAREGANRLARAQWERVLDGAIAYEAMARKAGAKGSIEQALEYQRRATTALKSDPTPAVPGGDRVIDALLAAADGDRGSAPKKKAHKYSEIRNPTAEPRRRPRPDAPNAFPGSLDRTRTPEWVRNPATELAKKITASDVRERMGRNSDPSIYDRVRTRTLPHTHPASPMRNRWRYVCAPKPTEAVMRTSFGSWHDIRERWCWNVMHDPEKGRFYLYPMSGCGTVRTALCDPTFALDMEQWILFFEEGVLPV